MTGVAIDVPGAVPGLRLVWVGLDPPRSEVVRCEESLSAGERERARRYLDEATRRRFIVGRAALRAQVAHVLGLGPGDVHFTQSVHGKPSVCGSPLRFSTSHSADVGVILLSDRHEVGVDIEVDRHLPELEGLIATHLAPFEADCLPGTSANRGRAFLGYWTAKEAYLKGTGEGLSRPPRSAPIEMVGGAALVVGDPRWRLATIDRDGVVGWAAWQPGEPDWRPAESQGLNGEQRR